MDSLYKVEFLKGIIILVAGIQNILKSLLATGNWSKDEGEIG